ncbi:hypothetical protein HYH02_006514 [Chlamydomonas schloesseri]|uniref:Uncharacterized protein n=1 Tax=Chlamydomonas schloesseri TaxID=2026947 RepID=A0A836B5Y4_9CHLO|nr:hypothetical protein HYH02_006514 [Chlamydomonas schloesseri]|eukprot:KAG2448626.1 hypothetical protein HYH02_006514 [Chlamydomonas schloesseri]
MEIVSHTNKAGVARRAVVQAPTAAGTGAAPSTSAVDSLSLERVYGVGSCAPQPSTAVNGATSPALPSASGALAHHPNVPGLLAYAAGANVVLYDSHAKQQTAFFSSKPSASSSRRGLAAGAATAGVAAGGRPFACLAFSRDGVYLAAGERGGNSPELLVWEVSSGRCLTALRGHRHGVGSVEFSVDGRLLLSTGEGYDSQLCVWDWKAGVVLAKQHTQAELLQASFVSEEPAGGGSGGGATIATVGKAGHFKLWTLALPSGRAVTTATLTPRPANLKEYRGTTCVAVRPSTAAPGEAPAAAAAGPFYALTQPGALLTLRPSTRTIEKSVNLQVPAAFALAVSPSLVACACAAGVVRLFAARTLAFKGNLPRPTSRSAGTAAAAAAGGAAGAATSASAGALFPDAVALSFDATGERLTVLYSDRSVVVWDVRNPAKVVRHRSVLSHAGIVWGVALVPSWQAALLGQQAAPGAIGFAPTPGPHAGGAGSGAGTAEGAGASPSSVLVTCGTDGSVRLWNVCLDNSASTAGPLGLPAELAGAAKVTRTLRAIIYAAPPDSAPAAPPSRRGTTPDIPLPGPGAANAHAAPPPVSLRCVRVSPCGRHLAVGDSRGNLRVYSLATLELLLLKEAHESEVLTLDYSPPSLDGTCYLASGSRDCLVHVYDMGRGYELVGTCDVHGGAVTAARFAAGPGGRLTLMSCSADKSVVFRHVQLDPTGVSFAPYRTERLSRGVLYDMAVDPAGGRAVVVGADGQLRLFDVATGRAIRNFSGDPGCGESVSVVMDPSGRLAVCGCSDGAVALYDLEAGQLVGRGAPAHGDVCTGAVLLEDYRGLVTVGGDGCALLWRLTPKLAQRMHSAAVQCQKQLEQQAAQQAAMVRKQQQQQQPQTVAAAAEPEDVHATPAAAPRRRAWGLGDAAGAEPGVCGGGVGPRQVHVDVSATILRVREGKPLLSVDRLPRWAQQAFQTEEEAGVGGTGVGAAAPAGSAGAAAPPAPAAMPAGKWALRMAPPAAEPAAAATSSAVALAAGLAERTWAAEVEEDDEMMCCDPLDEEDAGLLLGAGPQEEPELAPAAPGVAPEPEAVPEEAEASALPSRASSPGEELPEAPESACASNNPGAAAPLAAAGDATGDGVRRDLFREHFDSLGHMDQASASKQDPRRQSLSFMYRQARATTTAAVTGAAPPVPAPSAVPAAGAAANRATVPAPAQVAVAPAAPPAAPAAEAGGDGGASTPYLARVPLPAGINATRGNTAVLGGGAAEEADGGITSAAWTPERAMLPLTSPVLAKTDKQLAELELLRQRVLASAMRSRPKAAPQPASATAAAPPAAGAATPASAAAAPEAAPAPPAPAAAAPAEPAAPVVQMLTAATLAVEQQQEPLAASPDGAASSAITFAQPPPPMPAAQPVATANLPQPTAPVLAAVAPPELQPPATPGFSSLTAATPMLVGAAGAPQPAAAGDLAAPPQTQAQPATPARGDGDVTSTSMHMYGNPMFGMTPGTPVAGLAVAPAVPQAAAAAVAAAPLPAATAPQSDARGTWAPAAGPAATAPDAPGSAGGSAQRRVPKVALPAIKSKATSSPSRSATAAEAEAAVAAAEGDAVVAVAVACPPVSTAPAEVVTLQGQPQQPLPQAGAAPELETGVPTEFADALSAMQAALSGFTAAFRRLQAATGAASVGPAGTAAAARFHAASRDAAAEISALLLPAAPGAVAAVATVDTTQPPAVEQCSSPRLPQPQPQPHSSLAAPATASSVSVSASLGGGGGGAVGSSQVALEVGSLVESLVEEKLRARMQEELARVEQLVTARLLAAMQSQSQRGPVAGQQVQAAAR